jgi:hypothetical protein
VVGPCTRWQRARGGGAFYVIHFSGCAHSSAPTYQREFLRLSIDYILSLSSHVFTDRTFLTNLLQRKTLNLHTAFSMLMKWHTKPCPVKRPAKHPRCFRNNKDHRHGRPYTHMSHFASVVLLTVCALLVPLPPQIHHYKGLRRTCHPHLDDRLSLVHLVPQYSPRCPG